MPTAMAAKAAGQQQAQKQGDEDRHDQTPAPHGEEKPKRHQDRAADQAGDGALRDSGKLLVIQRHGPGDAHAGVPGAHKFQLGRPIADRGTRGLTGFHRAVIQYRLGQDEVKPAAQIRHGPGQKLFPGQVDSILPRGRCQARMKAAQRRHEAVQACLPMRDALGDQGQCGAQAAQIRIGNQDTQERLRIGRALQQTLQRAGVEEQQGIARQERRRVRLGHMREMRAVGAQRRCQIPRRDLGLFRNGGVNDSDQQILVLWKGALQFGAVLAPRQIGGEDQPGIGRDRETAAYGP